MHDGFHLFAHIIIGIVELQGQRFVAIFEIHALDEAAQHGFPRFEALSVMIADDEIDRGALHRSGNSREVEETLVARSLFGDFCGRHLLYKFRCQAGSVHHLVFSEARMDADAGDLDASRRGIEVFELQFPHFSAVHGVSPFASEAFHVEMVGAASDLLIGIEGHAHPSVFHLGVRQQIGHCGDNLGNSCFVVGAEQRVPVGHDQFLPNVVAQLGKFLDCAYDSRRGIEHNVSSVVVFDDARAHFRSRRVGTGVHVGDKTDGRHVIVHIGGERGVDIAHAVHFHLLHSDLVEFLHEIFGEFELLQGARCGR